MNSSRIQGQIGFLTELIEALRMKGVKIWSENGRLCYRGPKGVLSDDELQTLRVCRRELVNHLGKLASENARKGCSARSRIRHAPLSFSQLAHWHLYQLSERPAVRQIASVTRLNGDLNLSVFSEVAQEIILRHDALRTRIVFSNGELSQEIDETSHLESIEFDDLTKLPEADREPEVWRIVDRHIMRPIEVARGPLFGMRLVKVAACEQIMIVAMEHMIADEVSMDILLRDLFTAYEEALKGHPRSLPVIAVQFPEYATLQRRNLSQWRDRHGPYWAERLAGVSPWRFPEDSTKEGKGADGWGTVSLHIDKELKGKLQEWCRRRRTTLAMSFLVAYVAVSLRWCDLSESIVQYATDGRFNPSIRDTIGSFASTLYLRVGLFDDDSFTDLLGRITQEYCLAHEHADSFYMAAQLPRPEFTRNPVFNWVPQQIPCIDGREQTIRCSRLRFAHPLLKKLKLEHEPGVLFFDTDSGVFGGVHFPAHRFSMDSMSRFARSLEIFIDALFTLPEGRIRDVPIYR